jgi:tetratricopeptide (TPR) repeat protein
MDPDIRLLFRELADLSQQDRERILSERRIEPGVRQEIESLLRFDSHGTEPLEQCVADAAGHVLDSAQGHNPGSCGPYRLVRLLGSGGMGAVYLAERIDGEIQQKVAVKLLRADGHRPAWRGRFLKERQLLASLNHPSIVRVIDAGHTDDERPYLVMEYVDGVPIDIYAAAIDLRDRLILFLRVCEGVSHAHQHLIVHRDLKPSNILVDASGQPKLLDFGIAKLLDETADATQTMDRLLTPNYASPEQFSGAVQTTSTDVYSLGAVFYKLLTGRSPHEAIGAAPAAGANAAGREVSAPSSLNPRVPIDLDYVLGKALRAEPEERYVSVEAFANDLRAFLESKPVLARSGNAWYRTRKFLRRYWVPVAAATLVVMSLSAGLYVANRERVIAQRRFGQLRQLSRNVFDLDQAIRNLPGSTQARERLVSVSLQYLEGLASDARGDLDLAQEVGDGYERVARVQGMPTDLNLGESANAEASLKKADALIETVLAARPGDRKALLSSAEIAHDRMILSQQEHRRADALAQAGKSTDRLDAFLRRGDAQELERANASMLYNNIALAYLNMHLYGTAILYARRSVDLARPIPRAKRSISAGLSLLANALRYQGDLEGALRAIQEARKLADESAYPDETVRMISMYGIFLREGLILGEDGGVNLDRPADAIGILQKAVDITEEAARKDPNDAASRNRAGTSGRELGDILRQRDPLRALAVYDQALRRLGEIRDNLTVRRDRALVLANSAYALRSLHRNSESKQRIDAALALLKDTKDYPVERVPLDSQTFVVLCAEADYEAGEGNDRRALEIYTQLLDKVMADKPEPLTDLRDAPRMSRLYEAVASLSRRTGDSAQADDMRSRRLDLWRHWDSQLPDNPFVHRNLQAALLP